MCNHIEGLIKDREELKGQLRNILDGIIDDMKISETLADDSINVAVNRIVLLISTMLRQERLKQNERTL
jgi:hypothetical protein